MTEEIWKAVPGYEGKYEASTLGHVRETRTGAEIEPVTQKVMVKLTLNGIRKNIKLNRLIATTFLPNPSMYTEVCHIDRDDKNNAVSNLMWTEKVDNPKYNNMNDSIMVIDKDGTYKFTIHSSYDLAQRFGTSVEFLKINYLRYMSDGLFTQSIYVKNYGMLLDDYKMLMEDGTKIYSPINKLHESIINKADSIAENGEIIKDKKSIKKLVSELSEDEIYLISIDLLLNSSMSPQIFNPRYHVAKTELSKQISQEDKDLAESKLKDKIFAGFKTLDDAIEKYQAKHANYEDFIKQRIKDLKEQTA